MLLCSVGIQPATAAGLPETTINPFNNGVMTSGSISGTATADPAGTAVASVQLTIQRGSDSLYWNGTTWGAAESWLTATGTSSWDYTVPAEAALTDGTSYTITAKAVDESAGEDSSPATRTVVYDGTAPYPPNSTVSVGAGFYICSETITGSATSTGAGVNTVALAIRRSTQSGTQYWNGTSWGADEAWLTTTVAGAGGTPVDWSYALTPGTLTNGEGYTLLSRATDTLDQTEPEPGGCSVIYDGLDPAVSITTPVADGSINVTQPVLTATATDSSFIQHVYFSFSTDGANWNNISTDTTANDGFTAVWGDTVLPLGTVYLRAAATDYAGRSAYDQHTITVYPAPDTTLTSPTVARPVMCPMGGTTTAASGSYPVTGVELTLERDADNQYWNGTAWVGNEVWLSASGLNAPTDFTTWIYGGAGDLVDGTSYTVTVKAVDANGEDPTPVVRTVVYDFARPVITIASLSNGMTTYSTKPAFTANATDTVTGVKQVDFSYSLDQGANWTLISSDITPDDGFAAVWGDASLPLGAAQLRAEAVDGMGFMQTATIDIRVSNYVPEEPTVPTPPQSTFPVAAGGQVSGSGFTLTAPAGAVASGEGNVTITVTPLAESELRSLISSLTPPAGFTAINRAFSFSAQMLSGGTSQDIHRFAKPLTLTIDLTPAELAQITDPQRVSLFRVNDDGTLTIIGGRVENGKLIVQLPTFSRYIVGCLDVTFADLADHWSRADVELMASKGIVAGLPNGQFNPGGTVTRAEFVALLVRALGLTKADANAVSATSFTDVKNTDWFWPEVTAAVNAGVVGGFDDGTFRPNDPVSREQAAALIARALRLCGKAGTADEAALRELAKAFADGNTIADWALTDVGLAANLGIVQGSDGRFAPQATATRAEAATMIARFWRR